MKLVRCRRVVKVDDVQYVVEVNVYTHDKSSKKSALERLEKELGRLFANWITPKIRSSHDA